MATDRLSEYTNIVDPKDRGKVTSWSIRETEENWRKAVPPEPEVFDETVLGPNSVKSVDLLVDAVLAHLQRTGHSQSQMSLEMGFNPAYINHFLQGQSNSATKRQNIREFLAKYDYNKKPESKVPELPKSDPDLKTLVDRQAAEISSLQGMLASVQDQLEEFRLSEVISLAHKLEDRVTQLDARIANLPSGRKTSDAPSKREIESLRQQVEMLTANQNDLKQYTRRLDDALVEIGDLVVGEKSQSQVVVSDPSPFAGEPIYAECGSFITTATLSKSLEVPETTVKRWATGMGLGRVYGTKKLFSEEDVMILQKFMHYKDQGFLVKDCYRMALGAPVDFQEPVVPKTVTPEEFRQAVTEAQQPWYKRVFGRFFHA